MPKNRKKSQKLYLIVLPIPKASAVLLGNASLSVKDRALVALAALSAGLGTGGGISGTGVGTGVGAKGVGAVGRAGEGWNFHAIMD